MTGERLGRQLCLVSDWGTLDGEKICLACVVRRMGAKQFVLFVTG